MKRRVILLLNLAILVVNFVVSLGATETQILVARSAVRAWSVRSSSGPNVSPKISNASTRNAIRRAEHSTMRRPSGNRVSTS